MINNASTFINILFVIFINGLQCTKQIIVQNIYSLFKNYPFLYDSTPFNEMIAIFYMTTDP